MVIVEGKIVIFLIKILFLLLKNFLKVFCYLGFFVELFVILSKNMEKKF